MHDNSRRENTFPVPEEEQRSMAAAKKDSHRFNSCRNCDYWSGGESMLVPSVLKIVTMRSMYTRTLK